jgi:hypothetical protein
VPVDFWLLKRYISCNSQQGIRPERRNDMNHTITHTVQSVAFSFNSQARFYFAGRYDRAYFYYYGGENPNNLARQAVC